MKNIIFAVGVTAGVAVLWTLSNAPDRTIQYVAPTTQATTTEPVLPDWAQDEDAVVAAQAVIRKKELQAELESLQVEKQALEERIEEIERELGTFWTDPKNVKALIKQTFPEEPAKAIAIAMCESGLKPTAYNPHNRDGSTDGGLWQINSVHDARLEQLGLDKYDPEDATKFARMLYEERGGFDDWVCYWKNMHVAYLR